MPQSPEPNAPAKGHIHPPAQPANGAQPVLDSASPAPAPSPAPVDPAPPAAPSAPTNSGETPAIPTSSAPAAAPAAPIAPAAVPGVGATADTASSAPGSPPASPPSLDAATQKAAEAALEHALTGGIANPATTTSNSATINAAQGRAASAAPTAPAPAPIRGPRIIQGGREHRKGLVVSVGPDDIFIEFGPKELGVAQRGQWPEEELPKAGDTVEVVVERFNPNEMLYICLRPGAIQRADWELLEKGQIVEAMVTGQNKGGLELEVASHRAFMPASQIDIRRIDNLAQFVGKKLTCVIRKVDRAGRGNIVLSRRDHLAVERKELRSKLRETLEVGQTIEGEVISVQPYGAFVDIGGVEGLVHVSDMSHERHVKPENVVKPGDMVQVQVLKLDWSEDRLSLGMKQVLPDPFEQATSGIKEGEEISGRVMRITEFGAFVEIAPGVDGLVHISELSWNRVARVESVLKQDQIVKVKVLAVDKEQRRIGLSIKQLTEAPKSNRKDRDSGRTADEIRQETPAFRKLREQAKKKNKNKSNLKGGFGADMGMGLRDLKL